MKHSTDLIRRLRRAGWRVRIGGDQIRAEDGILWIPWQCLFYPYRVLRQLMDPYLRR